MSYLLLTFSIMVSKDSHLYLQYGNNKDSTFGVPDTSVWGFNTHLQNTVCTMLSTLSGSELKVWRIYSKWQIILNWTHMPHIYGQPSIWHLSRVQSTNAGENDFSPLRRCAAEKPWWQFFSGTIFCGRREVHCKLIYDLWKVLDTCFTAPRSMVCTTPLSNPFEGLSGRNGAPCSWVRLPALATGIPNHGINFRSQRGLSRGEAQKGSSKCHRRAWRLRLEESQSSRDITWAHARMFFKNKPSPFLSQEPHFSLLESVQGNSQFFI